MSDETASQYRSHQSVYFQKSESEFTIDKSEPTLDLSNKAEKRHCYSFLPWIVKWFVAVFLSLLVLCCVVASRICLLVLGKNFKDLDEVGKTGNNGTLNQTLNSSDGHFSPTGKSGNENSSTEAGKQALFLMLILALMIPEAVSLIYASWTSLRRKSHPWPSQKGFISIFIGGFLETVSLSYITIVVMLKVKLLNSGVMILLPCSLPLGFTLWHFIKSRSQWNTKTGKLEAIRFGISAVFGAAGVSLLCYKYEIPYAIIALLVLSIVWSPKLRKLQIETNNQDSSQSDDENASEDVANAAKITARGKAAIVISLWKLFLTPFVALVFAKICNIVELGGMSEGFRAFSSSNSSFVYFMLHIFSSFFAYHLGWLACSLRMQQTGYALPLTLATPIAIFITNVAGFCDTNMIPLSCRSDNQLYTLAGGGLPLWLAQFMVTTYYLWKSRGFIMASAHDLFWIPSYNGVYLEQYLLMNRRSRASDEEDVIQRNLSRNVTVFICTTMYHEADYEMKQLLESIHEMDKNKTKAKRHYESHVFFDGGVRGDVLTDYALQLASLVEETLKVQLRSCYKVMTPYGIQLKWKLPGGMEFTIHLKDNTKVKNKKRWSQVMYMSYVLDYQQNRLKARDDQCYILTTDADVKFTHDSVEALIDQIIEDPGVGAVCARTHPLGSGPIVWYQIFDYAIGHWFQKVANHMFGSVLCSPGCFSLYRCQAVRDVLPTYATKVDHAFDFLTKDMGEDRWMCTLMLQKGWRLTYCAAAVDSTYCPESFEEFYKQRRRWAPSSLANLVLLVSEWKLTLKTNEHISFLFIVYQTFLVCSTVIGPSTVLLVIVGGMVYAGIGLSEITVIILLCLVVLAYTIVCLFATQSFQLKVSKLLTFVFSVIMCIVSVGVAVQISKELSERDIEPTAAPTTKPNETVTPAPKPLEHHLPAGISTLYLAGLSGIFFAAALLHPKEFMCLLHGVWYLLCLPSGYLLLTIFSLCNLTDRSWGTREGKTASEGGGDWLTPIGETLKEIVVCKCCRPAQLQQPPTQAIEPPKVETKDVACQVNVDEIARNEESEHPLGQTRYKEEMHVSATRVEVERSTSGLTARQNEEEIIESVEDSSNGLEENPVYEGKQECIPETSENPDRPQEINLQPVLGGFTEPYESSSQSVGGSRESTLFVPKRRKHSPMTSPMLNAWLNSYNQDSSEEATTEVETLTLSSRHNGEGSSVNGLEDEGDVDGTQMCSTERSENRRRGRPDIYLQSPNGLSRQSLAFGSTESLSVLKTDMSYSNLKTPVEEWLAPLDISTENNYAVMFRDEGYDTMGDLFGLSDQDLESIGIKTRGHRRRLLREIKKIPRVDVEEGIPDDVEEWLEDLGLQEYWPRFESNGYKEPCDLEDLKGLDKKSLKETFHIWKRGHLNKLVVGIKKLQYPHEVQKKVRQTRREIDRLPLKFLDVDNVDEGREYDFWEGLRRRCLAPELSAFDDTSKLKDRLVELRNKTLMLFGVANVLWMIIILTLVRHKDLAVLGVDIIGLSFLTVYGLVIVLQFLALLGHRFKTVIHLLARVPWKISQVKLEINDEHEAVTNF